MSEWNFQRAIFFLLKKEKRKPTKDIVKKIKSSEWNDCGRVQVYIAVCDVWVCAWLLFLVQSDGSLATRIKKNKQSQTIKEHRSKTRWYSIVDRLYLVAVWIKVAEHMRYIAMIIKKRWCPDHRWALTKANVWRHRCDSAFQQEWCRNNGLSWE